jgi:hypothetical protein
MVVYTPIEEFEILEKQVIILENKLSNLEKIIQKVKKNEC